MASSKIGLKIIIAGGGIAGLTLANALEQAGIDYVLLERRNNIAPQVGASIGIFASGARILDQLGIWEKVEAKSEIIKTFYSRTGDGKIINIDDTNDLMAARTGYYNSWGERQTLLQILFDNIKDQSKILVNKNIVRVLDGEESVTAFCEDGSSYRGDMLVGCDGVNSKIRQTIWELAEKEHPELVKKDRAGLHASYRGVFGIANDIPHLSPGDFDTVYGSGHVCFAIAGKQGKLYWLLMERLPQPLVYSTSTAPVFYSTEETSAFLTKYSSLTIRPATSKHPSPLTVSTLWRRSTFFRLVPIEESTFRIWHHGRLVCAGDAIHKSTPNLGFGGNTAIESAAALANGIVSLSSSLGLGQSHQSQPESRQSPSPGSHRTRSSSSSSSNNNNNRTRHDGTLPPVGGERPTTTTTTTTRTTTKQISDLFERYKSKRKPRADSTVEYSDILTRAQTLHSWLDRVLVFWVLPNGLDEFVPDLLLELMVGAERLEYLPVPPPPTKRKRSNKNTNTTSNNDDDEDEDEKFNTVLAPFNPMMGVTRRQSKLARAAWGLPILGLVVVAGWVMNVKPVLEAARNLRDGGKIELTGGGGGGGVGGKEVVVDVLKKFYGFRGLDEFVAEVNMFFVAGMYGLSKECRRQMLSFITDGTTLLLIWNFEGARRANGLNVLQFPNLFALLGQLIGIGVVSPMWCFLHYVLSPIDNFASRDQRLTRTRWTFASLPAVILTYLLPFHGLVLWPVLETRQQFLFIWQFYPVYLSIALFIGSRFIKDTEKQDRLVHTEKDLPVMKRYIGASSLLGAVRWISTTWLGTGIIGNFVPTNIPSKSFVDGTLTFHEYVVQFLRWDEVFGFGSHFLWMAYQFWDLKAAGMLQEGFFKVVSLMLLAVPVIGPGATLGLAWLFRENILATRTHKGALTSQGGKTLHEKSA